MIQKSDNYIISFLSEMRFSEETYKRLKSIIHPKLRKNYHPIIITVENEIGMEQIRK